MDLKALLEKMDKSVINEETAKEIAEAFETAVNEKVESRLALQLEGALSKQDEDHAQKLTKLLEAIDADHSEKLQTVVSAINENHTAKLESISSFYKNALNEKAEAFSNKILTDISSYLDLYVEKLIPTEQLQEAVENVTAKKKLQEIRKMVGIDSSYINEEIQNTLTEGKKTIDDLNQKLRKSLNEQQQLLEKVQTIEASMILEEKTKNFSKTKKDFIVKLLGDKSKTYINENFNYVVEMFESGEDEKTNNLAEEAKQKALSLNAKVPATNVISESNTSTANESVVGGYLSELKKSEGFAKKVNS
jgi:hypothetical protein